MRREINFFLRSLRRLKDFNTNILLAKNEREIRSILINTVSSKLYRIIIH